LAENLKPAFAFCCSDAQPTDPQRALRRIPPVQNAEQRKTASSEQRAARDGEWRMANGKKPRIASSEWKKQRMANGELRMVNGER
jgi:hypothetical protein